MLNRVLQIVAKNKGSLPLIDKFSNKTLYKYILFTDISRSINEIFISRNEFYYITIKHVQSAKKKKKNAPFYFNSNYRTEMKLVLTIMDYCQLQFDSLKFFLALCLHGGSLPNFNFFNVHTQVL